MANSENLIPAKKGEVRNPKGRPKGSLNRATIDKMFMKEMEELRPIKKTKEIRE